MVKLPPKYVNVPASLVYSDLPASILRTGMRIYGLAWEVNRRLTPQERQELPVQFTVTLGELFEVCAVNRRQMFTHLRILSKRGVLRYAYHRTAGIYVFTLPPRSQWSDLEELSAINCTHPPVSVVVDFSPCTIASKQQQQQVLSGIGGECEGGGAECNKLHCDARERLEVLDGMGVLEPVRSELAGLAWAGEEYLEAWARVMAVRGVGVGLVVANVRAGVDPPALTREERLKLEIRGRVAEVVQR